MVATGDLKSLEIDSPKWKPKGFDNQTGRARNGVAVQSITSIAFFPHLYLKIFCKTVEGLFKQFAPAT